MSTTYDPELSTDKDWVRLLAGDRDVTAARLSDEEIEGILGEEANKYLAAARVGDLILIRFGGVVSKQVGDLKLQYSDNAAGVYGKYLRSLREKGASLTISKPKVFRVLGST